MKTTSTMTRGMTTDPFALARRLEILRADPPAQRVHPTTCAIAIEPAAANRVAMASLRVGPKAARVPAARDQPAALRAGQRKQVDLPALDPLARDPVVADQPKQVRELAVTLDRAAKVVHLVDHQVARAADREAADRDPVLHVPVLPDEVDPIAVDQTAADPVHPADRLVDLVEVDLVEAGLVEVGLVADQVADQAKAGPVAVGPVEVDQVAADQVAVGLVVVGLVVVDRVEVDRVEADRARVVPIAAAEDRLLLDLARLIYRPIVWMHDDLFR